MEFDTEEAKKKYLEEHDVKPGTKLTVKKREEKKEEKKEDGSEKKPEIKSESEEYESVSGGSKWKDMPDRLKLLEKYPRHTPEEYGEYDDLSQRVRDDLIRMHGTQLNKVIHKLSKLPIATLKSRYTFIGKQLEIARSQNDSKVVKNLQEMRKHIERAVDKKDKK
jgi:hypothetical protein